MQSNFIYLHYVNIMFTTLSIVKTEMKTKKKKVMFAQVFFLSLSRKLQSS